MSKQMNIKQKARENKDLYRVETDEDYKLKFFLPIPPSVNHMYIHTKRGEKILTKRAKRYTEDAQALIYMAIDKQGWKIPERELWMYADIGVYMPDRILRDSHNLLKLSLDVMEGLVFENDYFIMPRIQTVEYSKECPRIEILLTNQTAKERAIWLEEFKR